MNWQDRILNDGTDHDSWLLARRPEVCASDVAGYARLGSVEKYVSAKLMTSKFNGNSFTRAGHRWEPMMLAWAGIPQNLALIHSSAERGFAATPDGLGDRLAECKVKHLKVVDGPDVGEWRQLAWHFLCIDEVDVSEFIWVELDAKGEIRASLNGEPKHLTVRRDDPRIVAATEQVLPIARAVLEQLTAALDFERQLAS